MQPVVVISPIWQFGRSNSPLEDRRGATLQAIEQAIQQHLFGGDATTPAVAMHAFAKAVSGISWPRDGDAARLLEDCAGKEESRWRVLFCTTLHALCWSLAAARFDSGAEDALPELFQDEDADDDEVDGEADLLHEHSNDAAEPLHAEAMPLRLLAVDKTEAVSAVARALLQLGRPAQPQPALIGDAESDRGDRTVELARLVGKALLETLLTSMGDTFAVGEHRMVVEGGQPRTRQTIAINSPALAEGVSAMLAELPLRFTPQPLRQPVAYGSNHANEDEAAFRVPLIGYRRRNAYLRRFQSKLVLGANFPDYLAAVNRQQAVAWRANRDLWRWALKLRELARPRTHWLPDLNAAVDDAGLGDAEILEWQQWLDDRLYRLPERRERRGATEAPADFLDNTLARNALQELMFPREGGPAQTFYLPWKADYRGRIYAQTPWLTPQGGDLQRALFEFAKGQALDEPGVKALRRHGASLANRKVLLSDLKIEGRTVLTLEERERWIQLHEQDIVNSAAAPLKHRFWRDVASKPFQFLAFCIAYAQWVNDPQAAIHLPVQIDGTCNGLQHIAALTGDVKLASSVNVLSREDGLPGDIYSELAAHASGKVAAAAPESNSTDSDGATETLHRMALQWAEDALRVNSGLRALLDRSAAKVVVMTVPYGASPASQAAAMVELLAGPRRRRQRQSARESGLKPQRAPILKRLDESPLSRELIDRLNDLAGKFEPQSAEDKFVRRCLRGRLSDRSLADGPAARISAASVRVLAAYLAQAMVLALRHALFERFPKVNAFRRWLGQVGGACAGLPLAWVTPLGLPVCQDGFNEQRATLKARAGSKLIQVGVSRLLEEPGQQAQSRQLLPNLIHSLDATHLAMSIERASREGLRDFGSIHDCLLCRPNEADRWSAVLWQSFVELYRSDQPGGVARVLAQWHHWMGVLVRIAGVKGANLVLGALDLPGGVGEKLLMAQAREEASGPKPAKGAPAHADACDLLACLRTLPALELGIARQVLEHVTNRQTPLVHRPGGKLKSDILRPALPLDGDRPTRYFFS